MFRNLGTQLIITLLTIQLMLNATVIEGTTTERDNKEKCEESSSFQSLLYHNESGRCYEMGTSGPCPNNLKFFQIPIGSIYGDCDCPQPGDVVGDDNKFPTVYNKVHDRCYSIYTQGYCEKNQWLTFQDNNKIKCVDNPCVNTSLTNVVSLDGQCVSLGSVCSKGQGGENRVVLHGYGKPVCEQNIYSYKLSSGSLKCGKGLALDATGECSEIVEFE